MHMRRFPITSSKIGAASGTDCQVETIEVLSKKKALSLIASCIMLVRW